MAVRRGLCKFFFFSNILSRGAVMCGLFITPELGLGARWLGDFGRWDGWLAPKGAGLTP